jgi:putative flippase GtrA
MKPLCVLSSMLKLFKTKSVRYLIAGGWNTAFGYFLGVGLYLLLSDRLHITLIAIICNILAISMSFLTYKLFVFKTHGNWLNEYLRSFVVYGTMALLGILFLWCFVDVLGVKIWWAQALVILFTVFISYFGHRLFTFKSH